MYSKEIKGTWFGVAIPAWLRAFDCRSDETVTDTLGHVLFGSEKAEEDMGIRGRVSCPVSCRTYIDARTCDESELSRQVRDMVASATKARSEGNEVVAVAMANYGWSCLAERK